MINLSLLASGIDAFIAYIIFLKIFLVYRKHRGDSLAESFWDFSMAYLMIALYFSATIFIVQFLFRDEYYNIGNSLISVRRLPLYLAVAYILALAARFSKLEKMRDFIIIGVFTVAVAATAVSTIFYKPLLQIEIYPGFKIGSVNDLFVIGFLDALVTVGGSLLSSFFFLLRAYRVKEHASKIRSLAIGLGLAGLAAASVIAFFIGAFQSVIAVFAGTLAVIPALLLILYGVLYKYQEDLSQ